MIIIIADDADHPDDDGDGDDYIMPAFLHALLIAIYPTPHPFFLFLSSCVIFIELALEFN